LEDGTSIQRLRYGEITLEGKPFDYDLTKIPQGISFEKIDELYASMTAPRHFSRAVTVHEITPQKCKVEGSDYVEEASSSS
jgi:hypothetical protein